MLLGAAYKGARKQGSKFDFCACPPTLVEIYECLGYRRYIDNFVDDDGYQVPLVLIMEDLGRLQSSRSPFAKLALDYKNGSDALLWFERKFPEYAGPAGQARMDEDEFWEFLTDRMHQTPLVDIPILKDIPFNDAEKLIRSGSVLRCRAGDHIVRIGDLERRCSSS